MYASWCGCGDGACSEGQAWGRAGSGSQVAAVRCRFMKNATIGAEALDGGALSASDCKTSGNTGAGAASPLLPSAMLQRSLTDYPL